MISSICFACPNWQASIENNQLAGWDYQLNPQNIQLVSNPSTSDSKVLKMSITPDAIWPNGHTRVEVKHNGCTTDEGDSTFMSWEFYLDFPIKTANNIAYWETDKTYQQSMGFMLKPSTKNAQTSNGHTELAFFSSVPKRIVHWQQAIKIGMWNKIALAVKWSESHQKGRVSVWLNNKPVLTELAVKTKPDANALFIQMGLHRNQAESPLDSIYLRNAKEVLNLTQLLKN